MTGSPKQGGVTTQPNSTDPSPATQRFFSDNCTTRVTHDFLNEFISNFLNAQNYLSLTNLPNDPNALKKMFENVLTGKNSFSVSDVNFYNSTGNDALASFYNIAQQLMFRIGYSEDGEDGEFGYIAKRNGTINTSIVAFYDDKTLFSKPIQIEGFYPFLKRGELGGDIDLNNITLDGLYNQSFNSNTTSGDNYPVGLAGTLTVKNDDVIVYQTYQTYNSSGIYYRSRYNDIWNNWREMWDSGNDGAGSGLDADLLDGFHASSFRDASLLSTGTISDARLPTTISSNITGNAATASNASALSGLDSAYYRNASNLNAGTISDARLPTTISSNITGNAATATQLVTPLGTISTFQEGNFTPTINCFSGYTVREGRFQRIQNVVNISVYFELDWALKVGTSTTKIQVKGVPFLSSVITQKASLLNIMIEDGFYAFENQLGAITGIVDAANDAINFIYYHENNRQPMTIGELAPWTGVKTIRISGQLFLF